MSGKCALYKYSALSANLSPETSYWYKCNSAAAKLESYENWVISRCPINNHSSILAVHIYLSTTSASLSQSQSRSRLDECVLLGRAGSSYLAEALWTIKIWFQSPAGCWAWGLGSQLQLPAGRRLCTASNQMAHSPLTVDTYRATCVWH